MRRLNIITLACLIAACASQLPRTKKAPQLGTLEKIDLEKVVFKDVETGEETNLKAYMAEQGLEFTALMFGSVGCSACNAKARLLTESYLDDGDLFVKDNPYKFELIGVNTDSGSALSRFLNIVHDPKRRLESGYGFVKWNDEKGETMKAMLLEPGRSFGVPFTAMLSRQGILWRVYNDEEMDLDELVNRISQTVRGSNAEPGKKPKPKKPIPPPSVGDIPLLSFAIAQRLSSVPLTSCSGEKTSGIWYENGYEYLMVLSSKTACGAGSSCRQSWDALNQIYCPSEARCERVLLTGQNPASDLCATAGSSIYQGDQQFRSVFTTHFNWSLPKYAPIYENGSPSRIPDVESDLTFVFNGSGDLIASAENLDSGGVAAIDAAVSSNARARGAGFEFFGTTPRSDTLMTRDMREMLSQSRYTVVVGFDGGCASCVEELAHWSKPGGLFDYCKADANFCQTVALEAALAPDNSPAGWQQFYAEIQRDYFSPNDIRFPLLIDTVAMPDMYSRFYEAYLLPQYAIFEGNYGGTTIFDQEGKVIAAFPSTELGEKDPVFDFLKELKSAGF